MKIKTTEKMISLKKGNGDKMKNKVLLILCDGMRADAVENAVIRFF